MIAPRDSLPPGVRLIRPLAPPQDDREVWQAFAKDAGCRAVVAHVLGKVLVGATVAALESQAWDGARISACTGQSVS
jgi:hypothetical protein